MSFDAYGQFKKSSAGLYNDPDLTEKGQNDVQGGKFKSKDHAMDKWFKVLSWEWEAATPADFSHGHVAGGSVMGRLRIVKYVGALSPMLLRNLAMGGRFDLELNIMNQTQTTNAESNELYTWAQFIAQNAFLSEIRQVTGNPMLDSAPLTLSMTNKPADGGMSESIHNNFATTNDAREMELLEVVFQGYSLKYNVNKDVKGDKPTQSKQDFSNQ